MDKKANHKKVKVVVRVRPTLVPDIESCVSVTQNTICIQNHRNREENLQYEFASVFNETATQNDIFDSVQPFLCSALQGQNVSIFAYGPTGSGKTHTMLGVQSDPGVIPRVVQSLFASIQKEKDANKDLREQCPQHSVTFSYMEIYNEKVQDLLSGKQDLPIREDSQHNIFVSGLTEKSIECLKTFNTHFGPASSNRTVAATKLNETSSRSHSILLLKVHCKIMSKQCMGKIYLIDLAGSEDNRRTGNKGIRLKESGAINKSLFVLGEVVDAINHNLARIPYRNSKLTRLLQDSIGGSCQSVMITTIAPESSYYFETYCTLNFATKSKKIVNVVTVNVKEDGIPSLPKPTAAVKPYKRRNSLIPVAGGKRARTSLSSSTTSSDAGDAVYTMSLPSPLLRRHREMESAIEQKLSDVDRLMERVNQFANFGVHSGQMVRRSSVQLRSSKSSPSQHLILSDTRLSISSDQSPDIVLSTPRLVDSTNTLHQLVKLSKINKLKLKKLTSCTSRVPDSPSDTSFMNVQRRNNSDTTPVRLKIQKSAGLLKNTKGTERSSNFLDYLNTSSIKQLQELQTVGIKRAKAIYEWRQMHGNFNSIDGLKQIPGLTEKYITTLLERNLVTM